MIRLCLGGGRNLDLRAPITRLGMCGKGAGRRVDGGRMAGAIKLASTGSGRRFAMLPAWVALGNVGAVAAQFPCG